MARGTLEVADILRSVPTHLLMQRGAVVSSAQRRVVHKLISCRTAAMGGHTVRCDHCGYEESAFDSCRDRHCPRCQAHARHEWTANREAEILPVPYFHVVFTLPHQLSDLALQNKAVVYDLLLRSAATTLLQVLGEKIGGTPGFLEVLHTWGQNLLHHPHVHCVVPAGVLSLDKTRWIASRSRTFLVPLEALSSVMRFTFLDGLKRAFRDGELRFQGDLAPLRQPKRFSGLVNGLYGVTWITYAKRPFRGPRLVLKYLARYVQGIAISNGRLVRFEDDQVTFRWKDYRKTVGRYGLLTLATIEFIRRFLLHVLPSGFKRIRYYGFLANRNRKANLELCRRLINELQPPTIDASGDLSTPMGDGTLPERRCPRCHEGRMIVVAHYDRARFQIVLASRSPPEGPERRAS